MRQNPSRRIRLTWAAIIAVCLVAAAAATALAVTPASQHPATRVASCGGVDTHQLDSSTRALGENPGALGCFSAAARRCRPASIEVTDMGVDTGTRYVFTIGSGGAGCQVTELRQYYSANGGGSAGPVTSTSCHVTAVTAAGVMLRCGGQDVLIPAAVSRSPGGL